MDILQYRTGPEAPWVSIPALKGDPGISVKSISINNNNHIVITLDDDSTIVSTNAIPIQGNGINILIVEELPTTGVEKTIYMVLRTEAYLNDYYDEYMWINNKWEIIGSTRLDLSNYYTKSEVNDAITNAVTAASSNYTAGSGINIDSNGVISANVAAADIEYDNTNSHMQATDIQSAIDYLATNSGSGGSDLPTDPAADGSYKLINTVGTNGGLSWEVDTAVPTKTSDLTNDSGFITSVPLATANAVGAVKPDGTTITIDNNGTISAQGDSSLPTDPTVDGSYKLVSTVETVGGVQTATWSWEEDSGGGANYTAGAGIEIDSNNAIHTNNGDIAGLFQILIGLGRGTAESSFHSISRNSKESLKQYLKRKDPCYIMGGGNTLTAQELSELGFVYGVKYDRTTGQRDVWGAYPSSGPTIVQYDAVIPMGNFLFIARGTSTDFGLYTPLKLIPDMLYYNNTTSSLAATTIKGAIDEVVSTRPPAALVSTDTAPTVEGAINWVYK